MNKYSLFKINKSSTCVPYRNNVLVSVLGSTYGTKASVVANVAVVESAIEDSVAAIFVLFAS